MSKQVILLSGFIVWLLILILNLRFGADSVHAIYDPLSVPNNRYGVHILDPGEITDAAKLVNSSGGDWGYVTVPIRSNDRDRDKWILFFRQAGNLHLIPIIRLSTYPDNDHWVSPTSYDLVDFANFLSEMPWPVKNRYVIIFNEPNHSSEWGDYISPSEYATLLVDANTIFKSRSPDYYLLSAGMDMSAPTSDTSLDALEFYRQMLAARPDWYKYIDGLSVHAYPNPAFSASPYSVSRFGITSFRYELNLLARFGYSPVTVFITETGSYKGSEFYHPAFSQVWVDKNIVAITPFVLFAGTGDFTGFSLLDRSHQPTVAYQTIFAMPKLAGSPLLSGPGLNLPEQFTASDSADSVQPPPTDIISRLMNIFFPPSPEVVIGGHHLNVDISDTPDKRTRGLSGRNSLSQDTGMLFIFPSTQQLVFWMKDMNFPLDFVWINQGRVVELNENVPPPAKTRGVPILITPQNKADWVLEVNTGTIKKYSIQVGDSVILHK